MTQDLYFRRIVGEPRTKMLKDLLPMRGSNETGFKFRYSDNLFEDGWGTNEDGFDEVHHLLESLMSFPKPSKLIAKLCLSITRFDKDAIILDFFAGSATTAHAVMQLNREDGGKRKYICVQLPEYCDEKSKAHKAGYQTIADIGRERIRRAAKKIAEQGYTGDLGFRAFRLSRSNIIPWNPDPSDLEETLLSHQEHLIAGAKEQDILYELLLKRGIELSVPIERRKADGKTIYCIGCGMLFACLAESITEIEGIAQCIVDWELENNGNTHVFFRAFSDDIANMAAILEQHTPHAQFVKYEAISNAAPKKSGLRNAFAPCWACQCLARYDGLLQGIPNPAVLLAPLTTREAVLSSKIEGTQATVDEVLEHEAGLEKDGEKSKDIQEILNYRLALNKASNYLADYWLPCH